MDCLPLHRTSKTNSAVCGIVVDTASLSIQQSKLAVVRYKLLQPTTHLGMIRNISQIAPTQLCNTKFSLSRHHHRNTQH